MGLDGSGFTDISSALSGFGPISPSSFGEDGNHNLYVVDYGGRVLKFQFAANGAAGFAALEAVPEPATWAMLVTGFAATGLALRRPRRRSVRASE
ncbi:PEPxxWA-CTERM sorting domain-containing protein [Sphingosinicellaceae bacterium]|nr:PEPxxWA-CTERM sorting domain-containing protein [Sphingosinicellaceae bacterium]